MPFENPIVAGEELIRPGIRSQDYQQGTKGWRVGRNGSAEFNDLAIRGTATMDAVNANTLTVDGISFMEYLDRMPKGIIAFGVSGQKQEDWGTGNTLKGPIAVITFVAQPGRVYTVESSNIELSTLAVDNELRYQFRCTRDGSIPTVTSPLLSGAEGRMSYDDPRKNTVKPFGYFVQYEAIEQVVKVGIFVQNVGPNDNAFTNIGISYWQGLVFYVRDEGRANRMNQTAVSVNTPTTTAPAAKTRYDKWWGFTDVESYNTFGKKTSASGGSTLGYQGNGDQVGNPGGNHYGCFFFDWNDIRNNLSGATILESYIYLDNSQTYLNSGVESIIGSHAGGAAGPDIPPSRTEDRWRVWVAQGGDFWTGNLGPTLGQEFQGGFVNGIMVGAGTAIANNIDHYAKFSGCAVRFIFEK